jgi:methylenetetrahydrofolate--tRNA-(uracil-5-)-methyltransferase
MSDPRVRVIGGGLAGPEAALVAARMGAKVDLYEMRPGLKTPAHQTEDFGELVCSNSLKSESEGTAPWLLKQEMRRAGSPLLRCADATAVPAGHALAVDRVKFSREIAEAIAREPGITVHREEVTAIDPEDGITVVASGPLTSSALSDEIARLTGSEHLAFYDSISPIVDAETIDRERVYMAARWDKGTADYVNCPFTREEYDVFLDALLAAEPAEAKDWEQLPYFESCLPIEELARRGRDTLRFGPMKPVGLRDPRTGNTPWAVVQLRAENLRADSYNLVGFQNHLKYGEQAKVLRLIPGLGNAKFLRWGQIHRNTYIHSPSVLAEGLHLKAHPNVFFAGQISGVEGYTESIATGLLAGIYAARAALGEPTQLMPRGTALGSLVHYITHAEKKNFQPANITFDLLVPLDEEARKRIRDKKARHALQCERALALFDGWWAGQMAGVPA